MDTMSASGEITNVSDTALMVAACRALESDIPDGLVQDPFAARLAGERGMAIFHGLPYPGLTQFGIGLRSRFVDELLLEALASQSITTVLSLGCGLDTRPWRLDLPSALRWIEVDFPEMLDYKDAVLAAETPRCRRERITADLNDPAQRRALFDAAAPGTGLMITEGLLMYLPGSTVEALAAEAAASSVGHWICDVSTAAFGSALSPKQDGMKFIRHVQASDSLRGEGILAAINGHGWTSAAHRSFFRDLGFAAARIKRMMGDRPPSPPPPIPPDDPTGVHRFSRSRQ
jgi:methyltransferase (TIGR00027 family)